MIRTRLGLLGLCAVAFGVMAFSASAAQAETGARWLVLETVGGNILSDAQIEANGERFVGEVENKTISLLSKILGLKTEILCTGATLVNAFLGANASVKSGASVRFEGCIALEAGTSNELEGCRPHSVGQAEGSGVVETNKVHALFELHELGDGTKHEVTLILPDVGNEFGNMLTGEECSIGEEIPLFGKLAFWDCVEEGKGILTHNVTHLIADFAPLTSLYLISDTAEHLETKLDGSASIRLASGRSWAGDPK